MVKKEIRKSIRIIFAQSCFPRTLSFCKFCITCTHTLLTFFGKIKKKYKIPVSNQKSLPTCWLHPTVWSIKLNRGYRLLLISSRTPICRDYNYFSCRLTSLFNPLGKSLRSSTMYSVLFYVTGLPNCSGFLSHGQPQEAFICTRSWLPRV